MKMKLFLPTVGLALCMPFAAYAGMHEDDKKMSDEIIKSLNLSDSKAERVEQIMSDYYDEKKEIKERMKEEMEKVKETKEKNLEAVLSEDEMDRLEEMKKSHKKEYKKHGHDM